MSLVLVTLFMIVSTCGAGVSAVEGREVVKLKGTLRGIGGKLVYFSPDGSKLLTVGKDAARVWDLRTMKPVAEAAMKHEGDIEDAGWLADGERVFTAGGKEVCVWDPMMPKAVARVRQDVPVRTGCVSPDGKLIVAGNEPGAGVVWEAATGKPLYTLKGPGCLWSARFSPDGKKLLTVTCPPGDPLRHTGAVVRILSPQTGADLVPCNEDRGFRRGAALPEFSSEGKQYVLPEDKGFTVYETASNNAVYRGGRSIGLHSGFTSVVQFATDGTTLMGALDNETRIYEAVSGKPIGEAVYHPAWTGYRQMVTANPGGTMVFFAGKPDEASVWDMRTGRELQEFGSPGTEAVAVSPNGRLVALAYSQEPTEVWEIVRNY